MEGVTLTCEVLKLDSMEECGAPAVREIRLYNPIPGGSPPTLDLLSCQSCADDLVARGRDVRLLNWLMNTLGDGDGKETR